MADKDKDRGKDKDEWNVPWPDGSWLTWNAETESWEKQAAPSDQGGRRSGAGSSAESPTGSTAKAKASAKAKATKTPPTKSTGAKRAKETSPRKPTGRKTTTSKSSATKAKPAAQKAVEKDPRPVADAQPAEAPPPATEADEGSSWQPIASVSARSRGPAPATPPRREPVVLPRAVIEARRSIGPAIAAGVLLGIAAGYLVFFLIR